jgi:hypothetical protein
MLGSSFSFLNAKNSNDLMAEQLKTIKLIGFRKLNFRLLLKGFKFYGGVDGGLN